MARETEQLVYNAFAAHGADAFQTITHQAPVQRPP